MPNRTVQFRGFATGNAPTTVTATYNGTQVYSGEISTLATPVAGANPTDLPTVPVMFTMDIPMDQSGAVPMTITAQGNPLTVCQIWANYCNIAKTSGNTTVYVSSGAGGYAEILQPNGTNPVNDSRSNVFIGGIPQVVSSEQRGNLVGTWWWTADANVEITYDLNISPGLE